MDPLTPTDDTKDSARFWAVLTLVAAIAFTVIPFVTDPFSGFDPARFPNPIENPPIQPAGWAFSIWGLIYLWLLASSGFGLVARDDAPPWRAYRPWACASMAIGAAWIPIAHTSPVMATILIVVMLVTALVALAKAPSTDLIWARWPLGLYAGWLTAATFVSLATVAAGYNLADVMSASWAGLLLALVTALVLAWRLGTPTLPAAAAWATFGITIANWPSAYAWIAAVGATLLIGMAVKGVTRDR